jgi:phthiocerol/phenolphthiocerol synthesis type-I polyketide synthase E
VEWKRNGHPRRAGVSSFGIGGTNAHVIVEEAPAETRIEHAATGKPHLLVLSAQTPSALEAQVERLASHLRRNPEALLADVEWTLQAGRRVFGHRRAVLCRDRNDAIATLTGADPQRVWDRVEDSAAPSVAFLFPGQGAQHVGMAAGLYNTEPGFRSRVDECAEILAPRLGMDLRDLLYPAPERREEAQRRLERTAFAQPALFTIEYALAGLWMDWGIRPAAFLGHSVGEFVAATLAGVMELSDALKLVALRGQLIDALPEGAMLSVELSESELLGLLGSGLSLAAVNGPSSCVVAGDFEPIDALARQLAEQGIVHRRLHTSHAFHSHQMDAAMQPFAEAVERIHLKAPQIPYVSGLTGTWITARQATDAWYWARHLREAVRFADGVQALAEGTGRVLLEVGPGNSLASLSRRQLGEGSAVVVSSLPHPKDRTTDLETVLGALGRLWLCGARIDWRGFHGEAKRKRIPLPTYPFERQRYWISSGIDAPREGVFQALAEPSFENVRQVLPVHEGPRRLRAFEAPETEIEEAIAEAWQELLGVGQVGRNDDFFELGGHSLSAVQLVARLQERLPVELAPDVLFDRPTVAALAELVEQQLLDRLEEISDTEAEQWMATR